MTYPKIHGRCPGTPFLASPLTRTLELSVLKSRGTANNSSNHSKEVEWYYRVGKKVYGSRKKMIHDFCMQFHGKIIHAQVLYSRRDWKKYILLYVSLRSNIAASVIFEFLTSKGYIFDSFTTKSYKEIWDTLAPKEE